MTTKSYKLQLDLRPWADKPVDDGRFTSRLEEIRLTRKWLDDSREAFNAGVDYFSLWLLRMHRGAGVCREKQDGIWREWREISTLEQLTDARKRLCAERESFALLENHELLNMFKIKGKSETEAVELAECCRRVAKELCPPNEGSSGAQMPRDSLDLLLNPFSDARGLRFGSTRLRWTIVEVAGESKSFDDFKAKLEKFIRERDGYDGATATGLRKSCVEILKKAGVDRRQLDDWCLLSVERRSAQAGRTSSTGHTAKTANWDDIRKRLVERTPKPDWLRNEAVVKIARATEDAEQFLAKLRLAWEFSGEDGAAHIARLERDIAKNVGLPWTERREKFIEAAKRGARDYETLFRAGCLPLAGFGCYHDDSSVTLGTLALRNVGSEWKRAMWNMAGQRIRSHLGWVRRRANERMLWELTASLFERGGWIRTKQKGRSIKRVDLTPSDIRFESPTAGEGGNFERKPAYSTRKWVQKLRQYESDEMPKHLEGASFGAAEGLRIRKRTAKGWGKVRRRWIDIIEKHVKGGKSAPSTNDLMEALNEMRARSSRDFGDARLFEWLAVPDRRWLWDETNRGEENDCGRDDRDCLSAFIAHNEHLADKPDTITFTRSDLVKHPVWPFFGENSAVEYLLRRERTPNGKQRLVLVLKQLLCRQADGSYGTEGNVKIALRGYEDFESSFALPMPETDVSAKQELVFRDDLLGGESRAGTLSGMKLTWEREELEAANRKRHLAKKQPRIYANFSCDAGTRDLPDWLTKTIGYLDRKNARDGMKGLFRLNGEIQFQGRVKKSADEGVGKPGKRRAPGSWEWPKEAINSGFAVRGTDLGHRTSSAGAWWRISSEPPTGAVSWKIGKCGEQEVYAVLERTARVLLPGDEETLPRDEESLRERLYSLRARLNLDNALLRIVRLLTLDSVTSRLRVGKKIRQRGDGTKKSVEILWKSEIKLLSADEIKENCRKAAEQLLRWAPTDAMNESLKAIRHYGTVWDWLVAGDECLKKLADRVPTTIVPRESDARKEKLDRDVFRAARRREESHFADAVCELRMPLAKALCDHYDAEKRRRARSGLWANFDATLVRELSYSEADAGGMRKMFESGLFRLLRKPPVTKHHDRKDDVNNLPHGKTHRGGLSMARLNFLDDTKNFVRRWSCRPRWPGDIRRLPDNSKFDLCDTKHLDNLREHRAKLIAHSDVAQTLGFEQDLRRGLWRFRAPSGELLWQRPERSHFYHEDGAALFQCNTPDGVTESEASHPYPAFERAHVLVYEDLTRYKMSSDRPKKENAGLARWSHRRILEFSLHMGELFGVPIATVDARFSSRFCSHCGAPGARADRFNPKWLEQRWMRKVLESSDIRDAAMKSIASKVRDSLSKDNQAFDRRNSWPWVLRDGGSHFVCSNSRCRFHTEPMNADENAAANVGLRFLRGVEGLRITINGKGAVTKSVGYIPAGTVLKPQDSGESSFWTVESDKGLGSRKKAAEQSSGPYVNGADDEQDETVGERYLFRDPSGTFRRAESWFEAKVFWHDVAVSCAAGVHAANASHTGTELMD